MSGTPVEPGGVLDRGGFYMTPWPLSEKYFLASHTYSHEQTDPTGYAIYLVDVFGTKELIYRDPDISSFVPIPLEPRVRPPILADVTNAKIEYATCVIGDIGRGVTGVSPQAIRFLRIAHRLQWPYDNQHGGQRYAEKAWPHNWTPARVIGTVPIEADGSACFQVPANTPLYFQLLDENHMELRRMRSFISFQPGEVRGCVGCHETRAEVGASRRAPIAARRSPSIPVPPPWGTQAISFLRDIQPVFDRHCTECHGGLSPAAELDFSKGLTAQHNRAYDTILTRELVSWSDVNEDAKITAPLAFGSHRSKLVEVLRNTPHRERAKLSEEDWLRLVTWIDANAPYHGGFINKRPEHPAYDLPADTELTTRIASVHARRCSPCHKPEAITRADWIDLDRPQQSLFLTAPLSEPAGNGQRCTGAVYRDTSDSDYRMLLQTVENAVKKARSFPRRDVKFLAETPSSRDLLGMKPPGMKP